MAKEKKSQKFDRNRKSASNSMYKLANRHEVHKNERIAKDKQRKAEPKEMKVARGTARAKRRAHLQEQREAA